MCTEWNIYITAKVYCSDTEAENNRNKPNSIFFFSFQTFFLFEKPVLTLENVSDKTPYPKQPIILFMCLIFNTNKNSDILTKTKIKTRNAFKELI